jgi:WASH complex subunit strumpellin
MKQASIMNLPLSRMMEAGSEDIENIATYYSQELVKFVKKVLQVIPTSIFENLEQIAEILTTKVQDFPVKLSKEELKEYTHFEHRYQLAKLTNKISTYTEGILCLDKSLMGVIQVDPKAILVEGIRRELVKSVSKQLNNIFIFTNKGDNAELQAKLNALKSKFKGMKKSFEYIQDFLNIPGEQIWREEVTRIFRTNLDKEGIKLISKKYNVEQSDGVLQIEIPTFEIIPNDPSPTFLGRLLNQFVSILSPSNALYLDQVSNFYSTATGKQIFGLRNVVSLEKELGTVFLQSFDQMISYRIVNEVKTFIREYGMMIGGGGITEKMTSKSGTKLDGLINNLRQFQKHIHDFHIATESQFKGYQALLESFKPIYSTLISSLLSIGQLQLIRRIVLSHLNFVSKMETPYFYSCLSNLNSAVFNSIEVLKDRAKEIKDENADVIEEELDSDDSNYEIKLKQREEKKKMQANKYQWGDSDDTKGEKILKGLLKDLSTILETSGFLEPIFKVFVIAKDLEYMPLGMLMLTLTASANLQYDLNVNSIVRKTKSAEIDGPCFIMGLLTIFKQFHNSHFKKYLVFMSHYIRSSIEVAKDKGSIKKNGEYPPDVTICFAILEEILRFGKYDREVMKQVLGVNFLFDNFKNIAVTTK